jgi:hypothetical protein
MGIRSLGPVAAGVAFAAVTLLSACSGQTAAPTPAAPAAPNDQHQQQAGSQTGQGTQPQRRFAGTTLTVQLTGYDTNVDMVNFRRVRWAPGGPDNGHYVDLPDDPGTHRLPLAKSPRILSISTICSTTLTADNQGHATKPCTKDQLVTALNGPAKPFAELQVDPDDHITTLSELYTP